MAGPITQFIDQHYRHFNAAALKQASHAYRALLNDGGKIYLTLAGAMSTAELGISLAEMIRQDCVHAIACTGANLEEDLFNLVAHEHYVAVPNYRELTPQQEWELLENKLNRVTDTCIPEEEAMRRIEGFMLQEWQRASENKERKLPHQYVYDVLDHHYEALEKNFQIPPENSWVLAAWQKRLPIFVPGWEDSTLGNMFAISGLEGKVDLDCVLSGVYGFLDVIRWYRETCTTSPIGFFQVGGGIAGDAPICAVPAINQDGSLMNPPMAEVPTWAYFCQISDSTTSYGSYSGATPNEKITWGKLAVDAPKFIIESDATIVAPLMFAHILGH